MQRSARMRSRSMSRRASRMPGGAWPGATGPSRATKPSSAASSRSARRCTRRRPTRARPTSRAPCSRRPGSSSPRARSIGSARRSPETDLSRSSRTRPSRASTALVHGTHSETGWPGPTRCPPGERAKTLAEAERLWSALRLDRGGTLVALGGGSTGDLTGFVAATYLRGVAWAPVPTTLVAQVDAAIGGKVAIDIPEGKNLVGAFHWPGRVVVDTAMLATLPPEEIANGLAEVVKTGLLMGEPVWELDREEQVRRCAAFKAAVCLRDPVRPRRARAAQPRSHVRARTRGGCGLRAAAREGGRARPARGAAAVRPRRRGCDGARRARSGAGHASTATPRGPRSRGTRKASAARRASSSSTRPASRAGTSSCRSRTCVRLSTS